jgi:hypothetical protein
MLQQQQFFSRFAVECALHTVMPSGRKTVLAKFPPFKLLITF